MLCIIVITLFLNKFINSSNWLFVQGSGATPKKPRDHPTLDVWTEGVTPGARYKFGHCQMGNSFFLWGGLHTNMVSSSRDIWEYNIDTAKWRAIFLGDDGIDWNTDYNAVAGMAVRPNVTSDFANFTNGDWIPSVSCDVNMWCDSDKNSLFIFGGSRFANDYVSAYRHQAGYNLNSFSDLWQFDLSTKRYAYLTGRGGLYSSASIPTIEYDGTGNYIGNVFTADAYPSSRSGASSVVIATAGTSQNVLMFGGVEKVAEDFTNDVWEYETSTNRWRIVKMDTSRKNHPGNYSIKGIYSDVIFPAARAWNAYWGIPGTDIMYIFGGIVKYEYSYFRYAIDLWVFNTPLAQWKWLLGTNQTQSNAPGAYEPWGTVGKYYTDEEFMPVFKYGVISLNTVEGDDSLYWYGGKTSALSGIGNLLCEYSILKNKWRFISGDYALGEGITSTDPNALANGGGFRSSNGQSMYLFGGIGVLGGRTEQFDNVWLFTNLTNCFGISKYDPTVCSSFGECIEYDTCVCNEGYNESNHCYPVCQGILSNDLSVCSTNGECIGNNNCSCYRGYSGDDCSEWSCRVLRKGVPAECVHGICTSSSACVCDDGYKGRGCDTPMCLNCSSINQMCVSPGNCICLEGYHGENCMEYYPTELITCVSERESHKSSFEDCVEDLIEEQEMRVTELIEYNSKLSQWVDQNSVLSENVVQMESDLKEQTLLLGTCTVQNETCWELLSAVENPQTLLGGWACDTVNVC